MDRNVGGFDRVIRFTVGAVLLVAGAAGSAGWLVFAVGPVPQWPGWGVVLLVGAVLTLTEYVQRCPLNSLLGLDSYRSA